MEEPYILESTRGCVRRLKIGTCLSFLLRKGILYLLRFFVLFILDFFSSFIEEWPTCILYIYVVQSKFLRRMWWLNTGIPCEMIVTIKLINTPITAVVTTFFFPMVRALKIYPLSKFQAYNRVLGAIITTLHCRFPELLRIIL